MTPPVAPATAAPKVYPLLHGLLVNNAAPTLTETGEWPSTGHGKHLEPGVVTYEEQKDDAGNVVRPKITYLLTREAIAAMRPTAAGKPIVGRSGDYNHVKVTPEQAARGEYDGEAFRSTDDGGGWEGLDFVLRDADTKEKCRRGFQFSCAYLPTEVEETPGDWHGVPYDAVIKNGRYTHFAIVPNPRYKEVGQIELHNSLGGKVDKTLKAVLAALLPLKTLKELVNAIEGDAQAAAARAKKMEDAKNAYDMAMKNATTDEQRATAKSEYDRANAEMDADTPEAQAAKKEQEAAARKEKVNALRNAAQAVEKATGDKMKAQPFHDEADKLERGEQPLGGGDVAKDPGVVGAGSGANANESPEEKMKREAAEKAALEAKNAEAAKKEADEKAAKEKEEAENKNAAALWTAFDTGLVAEADSKGIIREQDKIAAFEKQPVELRNAWRAVVASVPGKTADERLGHLRAKATAAVELRNAAEARAKAARDAEAEKDRRFKELQNAAAVRDALHGPSAMLGESVEEKAALGDELYG